MSSYRKDLASFCRNSGWTIEQTRGGHLRLRHPDAAGFVIASNTPRDGVRALRNVIADARRKLGSPLVVPATPADRTTDPVELAPVGVPMGPLEEPTPSPLRGSPVHDLVERFCRPLVEKPGRVGEYKRLQLEEAAAAHAYVFAFDPLEREDLKREFLRSSENTAIIFDGPAQLIKFPDIDWDLVSLVVPSGDHVFITLAGATDDDGPVHTPLTAFVAVVIDCSGADTLLQVWGLEPKELRALDLGKVPHYNNELQHIGFMLAYSTFAATHALHSALYRKKAVGDMTVILEPARPVIEIEKREPFTLDLKGMTAGVVAETDDVEAQEILRRLLGN
jgi:predicted RNA binding protein YcfA (HicA-like mRNA interferase family)